MDRARGEFEAAGGRVVLIGQATPRQAAHFRRRRKLTVPVLADEPRATYKLIGARKGSFGELLGPKSVARGVAVTARTGMVQGRVIGSASQLGGALVIAPGGRVLLEHLATDASDNVRPEQLLEAIRAAA